MQIIPLVNFGSVSAQLLGTGGVSLLSVDGEFIVAIMTSCGGTIEDI